MKIELNISKKYFVTIIIAMFFLASLIIVFAYNPNFNRQASNAQNFGHSADELVIKLSNGSLITAQELLENGLPSFPTQPANLQNYSLINLPATIGNYNLTQIIGFKPKYLVLQTLESYSPSGPTIELYDNFLMDELYLNHTQTTRASGQFTYSKGTFSIESINSGSGVQYTTLRKVNILAFK